MQWTVVVPLNDLRRAKSRLIAATATAAEHRALVQAIRADALDACVRAALVARVVVVTDSADAKPPLLEGAPERRATVHLTADPPQGGLNAAVRAGAAYCAQWPEDGIAVVVSDLPCLTFTALDDVLRAAAAQPRAMVIDRQGTGTTVLTARPGAELSPQFGAGSAQRHLRSGAVALPAAAAVRTDVDTAADLAVARTVGVGPMTRAFTEVRTQSDEA